MVERDPARDPQIAIDVDQLARLEGAPESGASSSQKVALTGSLPAARPNRRHIASNAYLQSAGVIIEKPVTIGAYSMIVRHGPERT
jgi:hypothetical protein